MFNFRVNLNVFDFRVNNSVFVFEELRQVSTTYIAIFVDGGCEYGSAIAAKPIRVIGPSSKE